MGSETTSSNTESTENSDIVPVEQPTIEPEKAPIPRGKATIPEEGNAAPIVVSTPKTSRKSPTVVDTVMKKPPERIYPIMKPLQWDPVLTKKINKLAIGCEIAVADTSGEFHRGNTVAVSDLPDDAAEKKRFLKEHTISVTTSDRP